MAKDGTAEVVGIDQAPSNEVSENVPVSEEVAAAESFVRSRGADPDKGRLGGKFRPSEAPGARRITREELIEAGEIDEEDEGDYDGDDEGEEEPEPTQAAAPATPAPAQKAVPAPDPSAPLLSPELSAQLSKEILGDDPDKIHVERRRAAREAKLEERNQQLEEILTEVLRSGMKSPVPPVEDAPEAAPDWFENPEGAVKRHLTPLEEQNRQLQERLDRIERERFTDRIRSGEEAFAASLPGGKQAYEQTIQRYREETFKAYVELGVSEEKALDILKNQDRGVFALAQETGRPPWEIMHSFATTFLRGRGIAPTNGAQPAAQPVQQPQVQPGRVAVAQHVRKAPVRQDGSIAAARAAMQSPAAITLSEGSDEGAVDEFSPEAMLEGGVTRHTVSRLISSRGKAGFFDVLNKIEKRALAERQR